METQNKKKYSKPLPSLQFIQILKSICSKDQSKNNSYDNKNHTLIIGNCNSFETVLKNQYQRSIQSFQRQLNMLGFRKKIFDRSQQSPNKQNYQKYQNQDQYDKKSQKQYSFDNTYSKNINAFTPVKEIKEQSFLKREGNVDYNSAREKQRIKIPIQQKPISSCFSGFKKHQGKQDDVSKSFVKTKNQEKPTNKQDNNFPKKSQTVINLSLLLKGIDERSPQQKPLIKNESQISQKISIKKEQIPQKIVYYIWRGRKQILVTNKLKKIQKNLKSNIQNSQQLIFEIKQKRVKIDKIMQSLIFSAMITGQQTQIPFNYDKQAQQIKQNGHSCNYSQFAIEYQRKMKNAINQMRNMVNQIQKKTNIIGSDMSQQLGNQLELYRMLIYKQRQKQRKQKTNDYHQQSQQPQMELQPN